MAELPKHRQVYDAIRAEMTSGQWRAGDRLPSEAELVRQFGVSRITVGRAMRDLQLEGLIERRVGAGTFVRGEEARREFALIIPDLGRTDIFEPICQGMMASPRSGECSLVWGSVPNGGAEADRAWSLCRQAIESGVSGVFFAPLELSADSVSVNQRIAAALDEAGVPLVLLDRPLGVFPHPATHDLVGIDNRQAGFTVAAHLRGRRRVGFVGYQRAAATVDAREAGYREAFAGDVPESLRLAAEDDGLVADYLQGEELDGVVCSNDRIAGHVMQVLRKLGRSVPGDVAVVGIDDVEYARLLPVPLTTLRQPTQRLGEVALQVMLERLAWPDLPPRDTRLHCELIVRESCGVSAEPAR